jgi:hypothetical protein
MWKWLAANWFKLAIVLILWGFTYTYNKTQEINAYVQCTLTVAQNDMNSSDYSLCETTLTHHQEGIFLTQY